MTNVTQQAQNEVHQEVVAIVNELPPEEFVRGKVPSVYTGKLVGPAIKPVERKRPTSLTNKQFCDPQGYFARYCEECGIEPTRRQASKYLRGEGIVFQMMERKRQAEELAGELQNV